jgi:DNA polymerase-3 subunit gamma/tau
MPSVSMSYTVLARKYRPQTFSEMLGQEHIRTALQNSFLSGKIGHAYLFYGPRGVGKTSSARLMAKLLNCSNRQDTEPCNECNSCQEITAGNSMDVLEIDAASNRGIDNIRDLRENAKFMPLAAPYKIYIIDEVHMLTMESFNALLKTLEEPPPHIKFIFATTEYKKIPATILSRCQEFHFHRVKPEHLRDHLASILKREELKFEDEALFWVVERADGSVRDSLSILDQAIAFSNGNLTAAAVMELFGLRREEIYRELLEAVTENKIGRQGSILKDVLLEGASLKDFLWNFLKFLRTNQYLAEGIRDPYLVGIPESQMDTFPAGGLPPATWNYLITNIHDLYRNLSMMGHTNGLEEKLLIEVSLQKISEELARPDLNESLNKLEQVVLGLASQSAVPHRTESDAALSTPPQKPVTEQPRQSAPAAKEMTELSASKTEQKMTNSSPEQPKASSVPPNPNDKQETASSSADIVSDLQKEFLATDVTDEKTNLEI